MKSFEKWQCGYNFELDVVIADLQLFDELVILSQLVCNLNTLIKQRGRLALAVFLPKAEDLRR